jgi:hypothetical protein
MTKKGRPDMKNHHLLVSVLLALLPAVGAAAGETVPCPAKKAGQWYRFAKTDLYNKTTEQVTKIDRVEGDRLFITEGGQALVTDKMHNWHKLGTRTATPHYYVQIECPFSLGETRTYKDVAYDGDPSRKPLRGWSGESDVRGTFTVTVAPEFESLTVKAGSFKAVKIVSDNVYRATFRASSDKQRFSGWDSSARVVSYYAPEVGIWIRSESTEKVDADRFRDRLELLEYSNGD